LEVREEQGANGELGDMAAEPELDGDVEVPTAGKGRQRPARFGLFFTAALHAVWAPVDGYPWRTGTVMLGG
jgi:hypothetical protein